MSRAVYFEVPAGTRESECRSCGAPVYWIETRSGNRMPVDCHHDEQCLPPVGREPGTGVSHFATCPDAFRWRRDRAASRGSAA